MEKFASFDEIHKKIIASCKIEMEHKYVDVTGKRTTFSKFVLSTLYTVLKKINKTERHRVEKLISHFEQYHIDSPSSRAYSVELLADTFAYFGLDKSGDFVFPSTGPNKKFEFDLFEYPRPVEFRHIPLKLSRIADKKAFMYVQVLVALGEDSEEMKRIFAKTSTEDLKTVIRKIAYAPLRIQNVFLKELKSRDNGKSDSGDANAENINNAFNKVQENRTLARIFRSLS